MIRFTCSNCGQHVSVDDKHSGKKGKCPKCGNVVVVPERPAVIEFSCEGCGQKIKVSQAHAGKKGKCPKCKNVVVVPAGQAEPAASSGRIEAASGSIPPESETPIPPETDQDLYQGPAEAPKKYVGVDRRLIVLIVGAAAIVVVGLIVLVAVLRPSGSRPAEQPQRLPRQRELADTDSRTQPVASDTQPKEASVQKPASQDAPPQQASRLTFSTDAGGAIPLRFRPAPGRGQTVELTTTLAMSAKEDTHQMDVAETKSFTFDLEVTETQPDGTVPIIGKFAAIRVTSGMQGKILSEYDSAKPPNDEDPVGRYYAPFAGKVFAVGVSPRGEIVDEGLDELFSAIAKDQMKGEDDMMRERLGAKADEAIKRTDERFGSREGRLLDLKKQLEEFPIFGKKEIRSLLGNLVHSLPDKPVRSGENWSSPLTVHVGTPLEMAARHTLTAVEDGSCTIKAEGQRSPEQEPFVYQTGQTTVSNRLAGSSQAILNVDRETGWLLSKEQKTILSGEVKRITTGPRPQDTSMQVSMEITTTVNTVK